MADTFPTALQRTSDERWVTLDVVAREDARVIARIAEASDQVAVVRLAEDPEYDRHLRRLLASPPPDAGRDVRMAWPVDLLHDMDAKVVGYTVRRTASPRSFALADFVDPARRAEIAPMATRRHLLRVARNVATATAALHYAGHASIRGTNFRIDHQAHVLVVRIDELVSDAGEAMRQEDERRLGNMVLRLLSGKPWASAGELGELLRRAEDEAEVIPAQDWVFALRDAEKALPRTPAVAMAEAPAPTVVPTTDHGSPPAGDADGPVRTTAEEAAPSTDEQAAPTKDLATALRESRARETETAARAVAQRALAAERAATAQRAAAAERVAAERAAADRAASERAAAAERAASERATASERAAAQRAAADQGTADPAAAERATDRAAADQAAVQPRTGPAPTPADEPDPEPAIVIDLGDEGDATAITDTTAAADSTGTSAAADSTGTSAAADTTDTSAAADTTDTTAAADSTDTTATIANGPDRTLVMDVPTTAGPRAIARGDRQRRVRSDGRHVATAATADPLPPAGLARPMFALAAGLTVGVTASVAPFAAFLVVACGMIVNSAVNVGRVKATRGPQQTLAIIMSRLVPFATGGLALAAFILLDLLLLLGLCMALAERLFEYGPGFTLTWVLQLPEVPGLVRVFAFCVGAFGGMTLGGQTYDRIRAGANGRRLIVTPAVALALAAGVLLADAQIVWWPLPLIA